MIMHYNYLLNYLESILLKYFIFASRMLTSIAWVEWVDKADDTAGVL